MLPVALAILLLVAPQPPPASARARATVRIAVHAVEGDSVEPVRRRWRAVRGEGERQARLGLATLDRLTYRYGEADRSYGALVRDPEAGVYATYAWIGRAAGQLVRWNVDSATVALRHAVDRSRATGDVLAEAEALVGLAAIASRTARVDSAARLLARADSFAGGATESWLADQVRCSRAAALRGFAVERADSLLGVVFRGGRVPAERRTQGYCLLVLAQVSEVRGQQSRAAATILEAIDTLRRSGDQYALASALQFAAYHGSAYSLSLHQGRIHAREALVLARAVGSPVIEAWASLNLAQIAARVSDATSARRHTEDARLIFERIGDRTGRAAALVVDADAFLAAGRYTAAEQAYTLAAALHDSLGSRAYLPYLLFNRSTAARAAGRLQVSEQLLDQAVDLASGLGLRGYAVDQLYARGVLHLQRADLNRAIASLVDYLGRMDQSSRHYRLEGELRLAEAYARANRLDDAERSMERAFGHLSGVRALATGREALVAALQTRRLDGDPDLGIATLVSLFARGGRVETAFRVAEAQRAHYLATRFLRRHALAAPAGGTDKRNSADRFGDVPVVSDVRAALPDSTALLLYVTGAGGEPTTAFVVTRSQLDAITLAPVDGLAADIQRFTAALEAGVPARGLARRLGEAILSPALAALPRGVSRLMISPDGPLHRLPFDALELGDGRRLLERYTTSLIPSARLAIAASRLARSPPRARAVIVGDPRPDASLGLSALPASRDEASVVARSVFDGAVLTGRDATVAAFRAQDWGNVGLLHLAMHARVEDGGLLSSALYFTPAGSSDGRLGVDEISALPLDVELVVLSACRTLGGPIVLGEGVQGLTAPFLEAGARTVVATYWPIGDRSILPLVTSFYEGMRRGQSAVLALREAKLRALREDGSAAVWAAFALTGDPEARPLLRPLTDRRRERDADWRAAPTHPRAGR